MAAVLERGPCAWEPLHFNEKSVYTVFWEGESLISSGFQKGL